MLNVAEVLADPDFAQTIFIERSSGAFALGGWQNSITTVPASAVITVASDQDLEQVPEGDRITGAMAFYTTSTLYQTHVANTPGLSDRLLWRGNKYRLAKVFPYSDYGYTKAIGVRMAGD